MFDSPPQSSYSVTSLTVYEACPLQYFYAFVKGIPPPRSKAMETGVNIHKLIADHMVQPSLFPPEADIEVLELLERFKQSRFNVAPVLTEAPFDLAFERAGVRGRVDLVVPRTGGGLEIVDFKSGITRTRSQMERSLQLPLYSLAVSKRYALKPAEVTYTYYFLRDGVELTFTPNGESFRRLSTRVDRVIAAIQAGHFEPARGCICYACRRHKNGRSRWATLGSERTS